MLKLLPVLTVGGTIEIVPDVAAKSTVLPVLV